MSLRHAILGFLSFRPMTGYDLKKAFDTSVQHFWPANQSQIYRTLAELEAGGLIDRQVVQREDRLDLKLYRANDAGLHELREWLSTPQEPKDERVPFLVQIYFSGYLTDDEVLRLLRDRLAHTEAELAGYRELSDAVTHQDAATDGGADGSTEDARAAFLALLTLEVAFTTARAHAAWLRSAIARIESGDHTIHLVEER